MIAHASRASDLLERLSERELEVFIRVARGEARRTIAAELDLNPSTVSTYRARVAKKLGIRGDAELALEAMRAGLIE